MVVEANSHDENELNNVFETPVIMIESESDVHLPREESYHSAIHVYPTTTEPSTEPTDEPTTEPTTEPTADPSADSTVEPPYILWQTGCNAGAGMCEAGTFCYIDEFWSQCRGNSV